MKHSKSALIRKYHAPPILQFEKQQLTSFSGLLIFQRLFHVMRLKNRLRGCFSHLKRHPIYGFHNIVMVLIVHILLGFRKINDIKRYRHDPMVQRTLGISRLPDPSNIPRILSNADEASLEKTRKQSRDIVIDCLKNHSVNRVTTDFDGSVLYTKRHAENTAVGYCKKKKGARSYYPLLGTIAQTGQVLDVLYRPGNVHDSNGAVDFARECFQSLESRIPHIKIESRMDGAFFSQDMIVMANAEGVEFTISVPFLRLTALKEIIESRQRWRVIDEDLSYFEMSWRPKSWEKRYRFIFTRRIQKRQHKEPLQLDMFRPDEYEYQYGVIVTNKSTSAKNVIDFHAGRGSQENFIGELKTDANMDYIPFKRYLANQFYFQCGVMAHNLNRALQISTKRPTRNTSFKRSALWVFEKLGTVRRNLINRAGRFTKPQNHLMLTISGDENTAEEYKEYIASLDAAG